MNTKKAYVSPQVIRVKLEPTQAVLSQCSAGETSLHNSLPGGVCSSIRVCKQSNKSGNDGATS